MTQQWGIPSGVMRVLGTEMRLFGPSALRITGTDAYPIRLILTQPDSVKGLATFNLLEPMQRHAVCLLVLSEV